MTRCCSQCGSNGHNSRTCGGGGWSSSSSASAVDGGGSASGPISEFMLFGVRVKVDPMRKSVSMNNLSDYQNTTASSDDDEPPKPPADDVPPAAAGYASADDALPTTTRERKRGVPWTEEEHKLFLIGLQKVGKGDWRGISRNFVKTRTPTQVASHAQKYYLRKNNLNRRRRRSSLFDLSPPSDQVTATPMEEGDGHVDETSKPAAQSAAASLPSPHVDSSLNGFSVAPFPVTVGPTILVPMQVQNQPLSGMMTVRQGDPSNSRSALFVRPVAVPVPIMPVTNSSATSTAAAVFDLNQRVAAESLSLRLALSSDQSRTLLSTRQPPAFRVMPGFKNGDGIVTVA